MYSWSPADVRRTQESAGFCSIVAIFHDLMHFFYFGPLGIFLKNLCALRNKKRIKLMT